MDPCFAGGKMAYGAIDAIGGETSPKVVASIRKSGTYILYGALDPSPVSASNSDLLSNTKVLPVGCMTPGIVRLQILWHHMIFIMQRIKCFMMGKSVLFCEQTRMSA